MVRTDDGGPYLAFAVLCERVLQEKDEVLSLVRLVDRLEITPQGESAPEAMPTVLVPMTLAVGFKSGGFKGTRSLTIRVLKPSGETAAAQESGSPLPLYFAGDEVGPNLVASIGLHASEEGLYWIEIVLEEDLLTRVPLRIVYARAEVPQERPSIAETANRS